MRKYSPKELMELLSKQASNFMDWGIVANSTLSPNTFREGVLNIIDKILKQKISITADAELSVLLVIPLRMIPLSDLISIMQINLDEVKINLRAIQSFTQPIETDTLHALIGFQTRYVERGLVDGKVNELYREISAENGFGLNIAQAISLARFYPKLLQDQQGIDIISNRINGYAPYLISNGTGKTTILTRPHWEASPHNLIVPYFRAADIITADS